MARTTQNLLELDVDKLFEDHKIEEIVEIEKLLDTEIERKRVELRSMVGDRYKDVLAASDAIKNMKTISQEIVNNIESITDICQNLIITEPKNGNQDSKERDKKTDEERQLIVQVRLAIFMNEQIWTILDKGDNLTAAQFYLLAQHIHMGLSLTRKEYLEKLPLLKQIKSNLLALREQIFNRIKRKLESVEITAEETSSNMNAFLLLKNQSTNELLKIFIEHRKATLSNVMNTPHASVRLQISAMVKCLITTIHLLHDCFMCGSNNNKGFIWQQLENIVEDCSQSTLAKLELPITPLLAYIPEIIRDFRPKCKSDLSEPIKVDLEEWLKSTQVAIKTGLVSSLELISNIKGLHIIREEALKIELPPNWDKICTESTLPENFNVWYYFFQTLITERAKVLITRKIDLIIKELESEISHVLSRVLSEKSETDLRWYMWSEESGDISKTENKHVGLSMKSMGYSQKIVQLCEKFDKKYLELLIDVSQYLYGKDYSKEMVFLPPLKDRQKFVDRKDLEQHLRSQTTQKSTNITVFLENIVNNESDLNTLVAKSLLSARFLHAITDLCPHFTECCTFSGFSEEWNQICNNFTQSSLFFWQKWIDKCVKETDEKAKTAFKDITICSMFSLLLRWDTIEIQEQTEDKVFKSQIRLPLKPSLLLLNLLEKLNSDLCRTLPHTIPKQIHTQYIERNCSAILGHYQKLLASQQSLNQNQSLQFLFDVKFLSIFSVSRENGRLMALVQEICDGFRGRIDPFDLDVFYSYLQSNIKRAVVQSQAILGCLLPSSAQLANLGVGEKFKDQEKDPSVLGLSVPSIALPLFSTYAHTAPAQKTSFDTSEVAKKQSKVTPKKSQDPTAALRSSAAALFGGLTTDWFS